MKRDKNSNIVRADLKTLEAAGFRPAKPTKDKKNNIEPPAPGSLLCLLNSEKTLWAELSAADIKHSKVDCERFLIMEKK